MNHLRVCIVLLFSLLIINSCKKDDPPAAGIDKEMLDLARQASGFTWYKNSAAFLNKSSGSGHNFSFLRTRYNTTAATMLDSTGKIKTNAAFPEGSLIVKELSNGSTAERYAILLKRTGHESADEKGWVWGYINSNETIADAASNRGGGCKGCHSQADNIDYMLMNKFFP
jgi:hypothetical protein